MRLLVVVPHAGLLSPQGVLERVRGFERAVGDAELRYLLPKGSTTTLAEDVVDSYPSPRRFPLNAPLFLDFRRAWLQTFVRVIERDRPQAAVFVFPWGVSSARRHTTLPLVQLSQGVERDFVDISLKHIGANVPPVRAVLRNLVSMLEGRACRAADLTITMSESDSERLTELYRLAPEKLLALPQPVRNTEHRPSDSTRAALGVRPDELLVVFHGTWSHLPNREAVELLRSRIAPSVRERIPKARFLVFGSGVPELDDGIVECRGFAEDLPQVLAQADAAVVPIVTGCGVRMKLFDYFANGVPCVVTEKGAEGLRVIDGRELLLASNEPDDVAKRLAELLSDAALRRHLAGGAKDFLRRHHDPHMVSELLRSELARRLPTLAQSVHTKASSLAAVSSRRT